MTLAVFSRFGTIPDEKERLNRYNRGSEISSLMALSNFGVILSGQGDFFIMKFTNNFVYLVFTYRKTIILFLNGGGKQSLKSLELF